MADLKRGAQGKRVKPLQHGVNKVLGSREFKWRKVAEDGVAGGETMKAAHLALWLQGASADQLKKVRGGKITSHAYDVLTGKAKRSEAMKKRDRQRRDEARKMREAHNNPASGLEAVEVTVSNGPPHYAGCADVMNQFVIPFMRERGLFEGSRRRTPAHNAAIGGSPTSSHLTTNLDGDACDFPTFSGEDDARALATAFGYPGWSPNSYTTAPFTCDGHSFSTQILWGAAIAHGDHVHVGIEYRG